MGLNGDFSLHLVVIQLQFFMGCNDDLLGLNNVFNGDVLGSNGD